MPRTAKKPERRAVEAAKLLNLVPTMKVPQAMKAHDYTPEEANSKTLQQRIRRLANGLKKADSPARKVSNAKSSPKTSLTKATKQSKPPQDAVSTVSQSSSSNPATNSSPAASEEKPEAKAAAAEENNETQNAATQPQKNVINQTKVKPKKRAQMKIKAKNAGVKAIRYTATQSQQKRVNDRKMKALDETAFKKATTIYHEERSKKEGGKSAATVCAMVNKEFGTTISARTVQRYVQNGMVGQSPLKMGPNGGIPPEEFKLLCGAFESYIQISQANADDTLNNTRAALSKLVNSVVTAVTGANKSHDNLINRLLKESTLDLSVRTVFTGGSKGGRPSTIFYDPNLSHEKFETIQQQNLTCTSKLKEKGYNGDLLRVKVGETKAQNTATTTKEGELLATDKSRNDNNTHDDATSKSVEVDAKEDGNKSPLQQPLEAKEKINITDTPTLEQLRAKRKREKRQREFEHCYKSMGKAERQDFIKRLKKIDEELKSNVESG